MRHLLISAAISLIVTPALSQDFNAKAFFGHRRAAAEAVKRSDMVQAQAEIDKARALLPSAPSVLLMGAQIALAAGNPEEAGVWLRHYIRRGLWFDPASNADLAALLAPADRTALDANGAAFGTFKTVARLEDLRLVEGVATVKDKVFYSTIHDGALNVLGNQKPLHALPENRGAYGITSKDGVIWMAVSPDQAQAASATALPSEILRIDTASSSTPKTFAGPANSRFGDIAQGRKSIYVSDGGTGAVLRLDPLTGTWQTVIPAGQLPSPQGLAESADGKTLIVADYTSGLYSIDLASGDIVHLKVPDTTSLIGVDGVARFGQDLIVVQNGIQPARILHIRMKSDWKAIDLVDILLRGRELEEPTNGVVSGTRYVFVARSQWSDFDGEGKPRATHGPAIIGEIKLGE